MPRVYFQLLGFMIQNTNLIVCKQYKLRICNTVITCYILSSSIMRINQNRQNKNKNYSQSLSHWGTTLI